MPALDVLAHQHSAKILNQYKTLGIIVRELVVDVFDYHGVVHSKVFQKVVFSIQISSWSYVSLRIWRKRPDLFHKNSWLLHHIVHTSLLIRDFLAKNNIVIMFQSSFIELTPCECFLFLKLKSFTWKNVDLPWLRR